MPVIRPIDAVAHEMHRSRFTSYVSPSRGSEQLCAWELEVPAAATGTTHAVSHEEVLLVLSGDLLLTIDGVSNDAASGDVAHVPAGSSLRVDNPGAVPARAWVTTSVGLHAVLPDGSTLTPPWAS
jgi:mannose-6-phosphate isomerase-like protein (cupin superfamily)